MERYKKKERERNDLAEGPRSRTERNDFKKFGTCPALIVGPLSLLSSGLGLGYLYVH